MKDRGFVVLGFPCNQFGGQEPWPEARILDFVTNELKASPFPLFSKIDVNGENTHPIYQFLKTAFPGDITWNFDAKFIVSREGVPLRRFKNESFEDIQTYLESIL